MKEGNEEGGLEVQDMTGMFDWAGLFDWGARYLFEVWPWG